MNSEQFYGAIERLQNIAGNEAMLQEFCDTYKIEDRSGLENFSSIIQGGQKYINAVGKVIEEDGETEIPKVFEYCSFVCEFLAKHKFVSPLLIKSYPREKIVDFDNKAWASLMKLGSLKNSTMEQKEIALKMAITFGVFEGDEASKSRLSNLINFLNPQNEQGFNFEGYLGFLQLDSRYDPELCAFLKDNFYRLPEMNLKQLQENWESIRRYVDDKSPENISRFLEIASKHGNDQFRTYMEYHNVRKDDIHRYEKIWERMQDRTRATIPTVRGKDDEQYEYEILDFTDLRVMRFGNKENIPCCQKLGGEAETSMINSAVEESSRVIMVRDEKGRQIAGSFVTHKISKDGKSYVCFDNIEVNASRLPVSIKAFQKLIKKVEKMHKKGKIEGLGIDDIRRYVENNPEQKDITRNEMKALEISDKIRGAYTAAIDGMIEKDEEVRKEQLESGKISKEEYNMLLMKNGVFTAGRNFSKIYLKDLKKIDKGEKELLPVPQEKDIYREAHKFKLADLTNVGIGALYAVGMGAILVGTNVVGGVIGLALATGCLGAKKLGKVNGIYTDAKQEQRILYDGRDDSQRRLSKVEQKSLNDKLTYAKDDIFGPIKIDELNKEQNTTIKRLQEVTGRAEFSDKERDEVVFASRDWYMLLSQNEGKLKVDDLVMQSSIHANTRSINQHKTLLTALNRIGKYADKRGYEMAFETANDRVNRFCGKNVGAISKDDREEERTVYSHTRSRTEIDFSR